MPYKCICIQTSFYFNHTLNHEKLRISRKQNIQPSIHPEASALAQTYSLWTILVFESDSYELGPECGGNSLLGYCPQNGGLEAPYVTSRKVNFPGLTALSPFLFEKLIMEMRQKMVPPAYRHVRDHITAEQHNETKLDNPQQNSNQTKYHQYIAVDFWPVTGLRFMPRLQTN